MIRQKNAPRRYYEEMEARNKRLRRADRMKRFAGGVFAGFIAVLMMTIFGAMALGLVYG